MEGINFKINHGSLIMLVSSIINPDLAITKLYQDYIQECQILLENNNNKNTLVNNMLSLKKIVTSFIFMGLVMVLQEAYSFTDGNNTVHSFLDSSIVYKCEGGF
jgi:hypothetical protein